MIYIYILIPLDNITWTQIELTDHNRSIIRSCGWGPPNVWYHQYFHSIFKFYPYYIHIMIIIIYLYYIYMYIFISIITSMLHIYYIIYIVLNMFYSWNNFQYPITSRFAEQIPAFSHRGMWSTQGRPSWSWTRKGIPRRNWPRPAGENIGKLRKMIENSWWIGGCFMGFPYKWYT